MRLFDDDEFERWLRQGEDTLRSAESDLKNGHFNWACFKCQQAAEYATKAALRGLGRAAAGHSVLQLLEELKTLGSEVTPELESSARTLDRLYIPTRYPNAHPAGSPFEFYDEGISQQAIACAETILDFVRKEKEKCVGP